MGIVRRHRAQRAAVAAVALVAGLGVGGRAAALSDGEAILPLAAHAPEARVLAKAHAAELRGIDADLAGCVALRVQRHGIAFRQPRGAAAATAPHLTLWVWLDPGRSPRGADPVARAGDAFRRHGQALLRRLVGRSAVFADPRVGGYGLVLTWLGPSRMGGRPVAETVAIFADKLAAANFVHETIAPAVFLARADVRAFDGQTELPRPHLPVEDAGAPADVAPC